MKKLLFVLLPLLAALPIFANEMKIDEPESAVPSFAIENKDIAAVDNETAAGSEEVATKSFDAESFNRKKKVTNGLLWSSAAVSSVGITLLTASIIMGFIPRSEFPDEMFTKTAFQVKVVNKDGDKIVSSYPPMMVYCIVGASLFCVGTFILLFALPIMFYSIVRKVSEYKLEKAMKEEPHWDISMSGIQFKF